MPISWNDVLVKTVSVGCGNVSWDGTLGYQWQDGKVVSHIPYDVAISAHANSELSVLFRRPVEVAGYNHVSFACRTPARYRVDWTTLGSISSPGDVTSWVRIPPGRYRLRIDIGNGSANWAHTLWLVRESDLGERGRLALVTLGCFAESDVDGGVHALVSSAVDHGAYTHVVGVGNPMGRWVEVKVRMIADYIARLPREYSYVLFADGRDVILMADEREIVGLLSDCGKPILGQEACLWPLKDGRFDALFHSPTEQKYPNAGCWGGERDAVLDCLHEIERIHVGLLHGRMPSVIGGIESVMNRKFDDQLMWQILQLEYPDMVEPDHTWRLCANATCTQARPVGDAIKIDGGRIVTKYGTRPIALHLSGGGKRFMGEWMKALKG